MTEPEPEIHLECKRIWDRNGFMNISVNWSLSSSFALPAIRRFSVIPLLIDSSQSGLFSRLYEYSRHRISAQVIYDGILRISESSTHVACVFTSPSQTDRTEYSVFLTHFSPQRIPHYKYKIEVIPEIATINFMD